MLTSKNDNGVGMLQGIGGGVVEEVISGAFNDSNATTVEPTAKTPPRNSCDAI